MMLSDLINLTWTKFNRIKSDFNVVDDGIFLLYLGNLDKYFSSEKKIITLSIAPSQKDIDYDKHKHISFINARFPNLESIGNKKDEFLSQEDIDIYIKSMNNYFDFNPNNVFFENYEYSLNCLNSSYFSKSDVKNCAVHAFIYTPIITVPSWNMLSKKKQNYFIDYFRDCCQEMLLLLNPDIIIAASSLSVARKVFLANSDNALYSNFFDNEKKNGIRFYDLSTVLKPELYQRIIYRDINYTIKSKLILGTGNYKGLLYNNEKREFVKRELDYINKNYLQ